MKVNERRTVVGERGLNLIGHVCPPNRGERSTRMFTGITIELYILVLSGISLGITCSCYCLLIANFSRFPPVIPTNTHVLLSVRSRQCQNDRIGCNTIQIIIIFV